MTGKIKLNATSGGGSVSFQAPSSTGDDRVITLPTTADGTVLTTTNPKAGNIIQVVQTFKKDAFSESVGAQNASSVCMSVNITPTSATNKLLIKAVVHMSSSSASNSIGFNFSKDGTEQPLADADGNRIRCTGVGGNERNYYVTPLVAEYLVTAGGTSQQTWGVMLRSGSGGTQTIKLNRSSLDDNGNGNLLPASSITIYEVAG